MKLHEIKRVHTPNSSSTVTVEPAGGEHGEFDVDVKFDYTGPSVTSHGDNYTFDEHHSAEIDIDSITLGGDVTELDGDGNETDKKWPKGTDVSKIPWWTEKDDAYVLDKLYDKADSGDEDYEPDYSDPDR